MLKNIISINNIYEYDSVSESRDKIKVIVIVSCLWQITDFYFLLSITFRRLSNLKWEKYLLHFTEEHFPTTKFKNLIENI